MPNELFVIVLFVNNFVKSLQYAAKRAQVGRAHLSISHDWAADVTMATVVLERASQKEGTLRS